MKKTVKMLGCSALVLGSAALCRADVIADLGTEATALITSAVTVITGLVVAGFAIVGIMWGARKIKAGIKAA